MITVLNINKIVIFEEFKGSSDQLMHDILLNA